MKSGLRPIWKRIITFQTGKMEVVAAITRYKSTLTGYHVEIKHKQNIMITKRLIREVRQDLERNGYNCIPY